MRYLHKNKIGYTAYDEKKKIIYYFNEGIVKNDLIIEHLKVAELFGESNTVLGVIADIKGLRGSFRKTFEYFSDHYYPKVSKQGQICSAVIVSEDLITHFLSEEMKELSSDVAVQNFLSEEEAEKWVLSMIKEKLSSIKDKKSIK